MESESGSIIGTTHNTNFARSTEGEKYSEELSPMTIISLPSAQIIEEKPRMAQLETLEARMASIEVSLSSATPRRRKGTSLGGSISARSSPRSDSVASRELRSALQDREAIIQNLRVQLGLNKLPRPTGTPLEDSERPAAEQKLTRLKIDADNKKIAIRNLRHALDKLDITDNIDVRIRQAELEYALGREELTLLSLVEEARALQGRLEKSPVDSNTLYGIIQSGITLELHAVTATIGRWFACTKPDSPGLWIEWALDGEGLCRGDRLVELNGKFVTSRTREELQNVLSSLGSNKCQLTVARQKSNGSIPQQQLIQSQENNMRLQHRISYLEDQVKELLSQKNKHPSANGNHDMNGQAESHVTSISIQSSPTTLSTEKPQIFQRGNFVTTIIDGKAVDTPPSTSPPRLDKSTKVNVTKTHILEHNNNGPKKLSVHQKSDKNSSYNGQYNRHCNSESNLLTSKRELTNSSIFKIPQTQYKFEREQQRHLHSNGRESVNSEDLHHRNQNVNLSHHHNYNHARSVEHLDYKNKSERRHDLSHSQRHPADLRSVQSLDFESDGGNTTDYVSEPTGPRIRPKPPKKPLRLSLQRTQSLQTVEAGLIDLDKKRAIKRTYKGRIHDNSMHYMDSEIPLQTSSLSRSKHV